MVARSQNRAPRSPICCAPSRGAEDATAGLFTALMRSPGGQVNVHVATDRRGCGASSAHDVQSIGPPLVGPPPVVLCASVRLRQYPMRGCATRV